MKTQIVAAARIISWTIAVGAVVAVAIRYDSLPANLPLSRWNDAPKSWFMALRVPLINLLTVGLIEVLSPSVRRAKDFKAGNAVVATLFSTAAVKSAIEAAGFLMLPKPISWTVMPLVAVLAIGLSTAAILSRELLYPQRKRQITMTRLQSIGAALLIAGILLLNLPLAIR